MRVGAGESAEIGALAGAGLVTKKVMVACCAATGATTKPAINAAAARRRRNPNDVSWNVSPAVRRQRHAGLRLES